MTALEGWENFYVIVGSSAGALIGLQFVVMALVADRPRVCNAHHSSLWSRADVISGSKCSMAQHRRGRSSVGRDGSRWSGIFHHRGLAPGSANSVPARVRGLAISCRPALCSVRNPGCIGLRGPRPPEGGHVWRRNSGIAAALHRHSQLLGCSYLPRLYQEGEHAEA